jgi:hypothetical protein
MSPHHLTFGAGAEKSRRSRSGNFAALLGIIQSMGRVGSCFDCEHPLVAAAAV